MNGFQLKQVVRAQKEHNWKNLDGYDQKFINYLAQAPEKYELSPKQNAKLMKITGGMQG